MSRVLVTGGAGFIGSHVVDRLLSEEHQVSVIDNLNDYYDPVVKKSHVDQHRKKSNFHFFQADIVHDQAVNDIFAQQRPELVIHLAARVGVRPSLDQAKLYQEVNIRGSLNVLEAVRQHECQKVILASSSSVYGQQKVAPFNEQADADHPVSPYAASKRSMELLAYTSHHLWGTDVTCLRFFNVYGERGRPDNIPAMFTKLAIQQKPIPRFGDGTTQRDYTYIDDIVDGLLSCCHTKFGFEIINLGNHHPVSLNDFIATLGEVTGLKLTIQEHPAHPADVAVTYADISKAGRLLNWAPTTSLRQGLEKYYRWFQQQTQIAQ